MKTNYTELSLDLEDNEYIIARTMPKDRILIEIGPDVTIIIQGPDFFKLARLVKAINEVNHDK